MGRWGEEDSKTKGLTGFFISLAIAGLLGYTFYINMGGIKQRMQLEEAMQDITRLGLGREDVELIADIADAGQKLGIDLQPGDIDLTMTLVEGNYELDCTIQYTFTVNIFITTFEVSLPIKENLVLVNM